jgi:Electron transfer DM13
MRTNLNAPVETSPARSRSRRWILPIVAVVAIVAAVALAAFQPWKLFIDKRVDESLPAGVATVSSTITPTPTSIPSTAAPAVATTIASIRVTVAATATTAPAVAPTSSPTTVAATSAPAPTEAAAIPAEPEPTSFTSGEHATTGTVRRLSVDGKTILRFEDLSTSNGPDVHVYLSPGADGYADGAINIATLKGNKGNQNYEIPDDVDLSKYRSVVIWCKRFSVAFGQAPLPGA